MRRHSQLRRLLRLQSQLLEQCCSHGQAASAEESAAVPAPRLAAAAVLDEEMAAACRECVGGVGLLVGRVNSSNKAKQGKGWSSCCSCAL